MKREKITESLYLEVTNSNSTESYKKLRTHILRVAKDIFGFVDEAYSEDIISDIVVYLLERATKFDSNKSKFSTFVYNTVKYKFVRSYLHNKIHAGSKFNKLYAQGKYMEIEAPISFESNLYENDDTSRSLESRIPSLSYTSSMTFQDEYNLSNDDFYSLNDNSKKWIKAVISGQKRFNGYIPKKVLEDTQSKINFSQIFEETRKN